MRQVAWIACAVVTCASCSGANPSSPSRSQGSSVTSTPAAATMSPARPAATPSLAGGGLGTLLTAAQPSGINSVAFPPRNEPFAFRQQLELEYRDRLRRQPVSTFVDVEGTIVWTQEYLRYRLSGCEHLDTVQRVLSQIDGRGIAPECSTAEHPFPPRNEPFDFRAVHLEAKYRDGLRRAAVQTFVDIEGDIVWTQEYLRYRVLGCDHGTAQRFVVDQIMGRPPAAGCGSFTASVEGSISGGNTVCPSFFSTTRLPCVRYPFTVSTGGALDAVLVWSDRNNFLELELVRNQGTGSNDRVAISRDIFVTQQHVSSLVVPNQQYELRVLYDGGRSIQPYTLTVTRPR